MAAARPTEVTQAIIAGLPPGPDLRVPGITGAGERRAVTIDGTPRQDRAASISPRNSTTCCSATAWSRSVRSCATSCSPRTLLSSTISADAAAAARSGSTIEPAGFPTELPELAFAAEEPGMVCLVAGPRCGAGGRRRGARNAPAAGRRRPAAARAAPGRHADSPTRCTSRAARAALVRLLPAPDDTTPNTTTYLVTDQGIRHAIAREDTQEVLASLGYGGIEAMRVPN